MLKKTVILSMFLALIVLFSGCINNNTEKPVNETGNAKYEQIPTTNLPPGITFMDVHETDVQIGDSARKAIEGIYRSDTDTDEIYIQVFNTETPQTLVDEYKSQYKNANYEPFNETSVNGHKATQVKYYGTTKDGKQIPKYNLIWTTKNSMIKVGGSVDAQKLMNLAAATNS